MKPSLGERRAEEPTTASRVAVLVLVISWCARSAAAAGQGVASDELILLQDLPSVFTASKYEQKTRQAPASVSIVTAEEIERYGHRTLADVLRSVRGLYLTYDRNYAYLGARGFGRPGDYNSRVLLLVDGHRTNDNIFHSAALETSALVDVENIERIEVIRGPSSSLYGTNAFLVVINVITKRGRDLMGAQASATRSSFDTLKGRVAYGSRFGGGAEALVAGSFQDSGGQRLYFPEFDSASTNNGWAENCDEDGNRNLFAKVSAGGWIFEGGFNIREKRVPTASFNTAFNEPETRTRDEISFASIRHHREITQDWQVDLSLSHHWSSYDGWYRYPATTLRDYGHGQWWSADAQVTGKVARGHTVVGGAEYRLNTRQDQGAYDADPFFEYLEDHRRSNVWAAYVQDEFRVKENLSFTIGARYDDYDTFGGTTNPRLAVIYAPRDTTVKLLYGRAFRAPNAYETYYRDGGFSQKSNEDLKPETIDTYEIVLEQSFGSGLRATASVYRYRIEGLISLRADPADALLFFDNVGRVEADGADIELEGRLAPFLDARIGYTYQTGRDASLDEPLVNSPRNVAKASLRSSALEDRLGAGLEVQYLGRRRTLRGGWAGDHLLGNLNLTFRPWKRGPRLALGVYNLLDTEYGDPGGEEHVQELILQDGRSYRIQVTHEF